MHFERITDAKHPMYQTAMELYRQSFPPCMSKGRLRRRKISCGIQITTSRYVMMKACLPDWCYIGKQRIFSM